MTSLAIASDHAGFAYKGVLVRHIESKGIQVEDFGTDSEAPVDYPAFIRAVAQAVATGRHRFGIFVGGSGNEAIVANRLRGIRCAVVWNERTARLAREHGDCNMIALGQRQMSSEEAVAAVDAWLSADFHGGRHQRRIDSIDA
ncbi:MAG: RpiB/LacA/LacB family sugar-phosphate isomerase [Opitutaceae bacterium]|nr:RpiB/LacA/LacB family sugar-phosphate isomerase [Opitutaceae bacterium]